MNHLFYVRGKVKQLPTGRYMKHNWRKGAVKSMWFDVASPKTIIRGVRSASKPAVIIVWYMIPSKWLDVCWMHVLPVSEPVTIANAIAVARNYYFNICTCIFICIMNQQIHNWSTIYYTAVYYTAPTSGHLSSYKSGELRSKQAYLSRIKCFSFVCVCTTHSCHPILRPAAACDIGHKLTSSCSDQVLNFFSRLINYVNLRLAQYCDSLKEFCDLHHYNLVSNVKKHVTLLDTHSHSVHAGPT